ncbi:MAG: LPS assembly lipoprotein LptE [Alphaproteobacteria bacterium]
MSFILRNLRSSFLILLVIAMASLSVGCKFVPLYGESNSGDARFLKLVKIDRIDNRPGQLLRTHLKQKFGQRVAPENPRWQLSIKLVETKRQLAVKQDATTTRRELTITATFKLEELGKDTSGVFKGSIFSVNSFNELGSQYAILIAENDARDRSLSIIANELRNRIMLAIRYPQLFKQNAKN